MNTKVTRAILHSYLQCKYKGFLKLNGQSGTKSDYEILLNELKEDYKLRATGKILAKYQDGHVLQNITVNRTLLKPAILGDESTFTSSAHVPTLKPSCLKHSRHLFL